MQLLKGQNAANFHLRNSSPKNLNSVIIYSLSCCTKPVFIFILVLNTQDILENVGNQTVAGPH